MSQTKARSSVEMESVYPISAESRIPEETKYFGICDGWKRTSGLEDRE